MCQREHELTTEDPYAIDTEVEEFRNKNEWLFDDDNDCHYCPKCNKKAAEELGVECN